MVPPFSAANSVANAGLSNAKRIDPFPNAPRGEMDIRTERRTALRLFRYSGAIPLWAILFASQTVPQIAAAATTIATSTVSPVVSIWHTRLPATRPSSRDTRTPATAKRIAYQGNP